MKNAEIKVQQGEKTPGSQKLDEDFECFINAFNEELASFEESRYLDLEETLPSVHVIGVPRSGTTLMTQLICSYLDVGYINNLIARFWRAPVTGIRISHQVLEDNFHSTLSSEYGKTHDVKEPHEFNYFWAHHLGYEEYKVKSDEEAQRIDWERVARTLKNIIHIFGKPVAFKSFLLGWHAHMMHQHLPKTCFVWIRRNPLDNALSLLETRERYFGSKKNWSTLKPQNYESLKKLTPHEQVAAQVYYMEKTYQKQLDQIPEGNYLVLQYEDVCRDTASSLKAIQEMLNNMGGDVQMTGGDLPQLEPSKRNSHKQEDYEKIQEALSNYLFPEI